MIPSAPPPLKSITVRPPFCSAVTSAASALAWSSPMTNTVVLQFRHEPLTHEGFIGQTLPQPLQLLRSPRRNASQPSFESLLQLNQPGSQVPSAQVPWTHLAAALGSLRHGLPHAPQLFASARTLVSQPSFRSMLQSS